MMTTVQDILNVKNSFQVWAASPKDTVYEAIKCMAVHGIGALVVIEEQRIVGMCTERDYARKVILQGRSSKETLVSDIMSSNVIYVRPEYTVDMCMALMTERRVRHLPVLDNGTLVGLISIGDVVKAMISDQKFVIDQLSDYITGNGGVGFPTTAKIRLVA